MIWLRIGGYPATEIAAHSPVTWETLADGGCGSASWAFALSPRAQHQALVHGALVEIMCGPSPLYVGTLNEPDRTTWECHAYGLSEALNHRLALDALGDATRNLAVAISVAIAEGWPGNNKRLVSGTAAGDATGNPVTIGKLLSDYAEQTGQRWGVDASGSAYMTPGSLTPSWLASPDASAFGVTNEDVVTRLAGRYDTGSGNATVKVGTPGRDEAVDLTDRGVLTAVAAEAILNGMLTRGGGVHWTNGAVLHREQLQTLGGSAAFLPAVIGGQVMRSLGLGYNIASTLTLDTMIGKARYTQGEDSIYIEPVNTAPRNLSDVLAS